MCSYAWLQALHSDIGLLAAHPEWHDSVLVVPCSMDEDVAVAQAAYVNLQVLSRSEALGQHANTWILMFFGSFRQTVWYLYI